MSEFVSLRPSGLPEAFDMEVFSEKPVVSIDEREDRIEFWRLIGVLDCEFLRLVREKTKPPKRAPKKPTR